MEVQPITEPVYIKCFNYGKVEYTGKSYEQWYFEKEYILIVGRHKLIAPTQEDKNIREEKTYNFRSYILKKSVHEFKRVWDNEDDIWVVNLVYADGSAAPGFETLAEADQFLDRVYNWYFSE